MHPRTQDTAKHMDTYKAQRVIVRPIEESDLDALMDVNGDDEVTRYLPYDTWQSPEDARKWYDRMMGLQAKGDAEQYVIADRASNRAIGTALLFRFDEKREYAEFGYTLARSHWGKGLAHEALAALIAGAERQGIRTLRAVIESPNAASRRLIGRLGFTQESEAEGVTHWVRESARA